MNIVIEDTGRGKGRQSVVHNPETDHYFLVSSVDYDDFFETFIFRSDEDGFVEHPMLEVWGTSVLTHDHVLELLTNGTITEDRFDM